jgi:hypothetical protein
MSRNGLLGAAFLAFTLGSSPGGAAISPAAVPSAQAQDAENFARSFFAAYDARDAAAISGLFEPGAQIVHFSGEQTDIPTLLKLIASAPSAAARPKRVLSHFEVLDAAPLIIVAFDNQVTTAEVGGVAKTFKYRESWFLKPTSTGLRAVWATYAMYGSGFGPNSNRPAAPGGDRPPLSPGDEPAAAFVDRFFYLYGHNQLDPIKPLFIPGAKLVHFEGTEQDIDTFIKDAAAHPLPAYDTQSPKRAPFDHFDVRHFGDLVLIVFDNHVRHWRQGHPETEHAFRENWLLKQTPGGLRAVWVAYGLYGAVPKDESIPPEPAIKEPAKK